jgi:hypothetical protein
MLLFFAATLTCLSLVCVPLFMWSMMHLEAESAIPFDLDEKASIPVMLLGWLGSASFLFALVLWAVYGITAFRAPASDLSDSLSTLEASLKEARMAVARLRVEADEAQESKKKYEAMVADATGELHSIQTALLVAEEKRNEIRTILGGAPWGERTWSFGLGFLSSLSVTLLVWLVRNSRKRWIRRHSS